MPISSGQTNVSFSTIQTEFGGSPPISFSEYYRGGAFVPSGASPAEGTVSSGGVSVLSSGAGTSNIPTSGQIAISNFRPSSRAVTITVTVASELANFDLYSAITARVGSIGIPVVCTCIVNSGVVIYSTGTGTPAFNTGSGWPAGSSLSVVNNGFIIGMGGNGGAGGSFSNGGAGGGGGSALNLTIATTINNLGWMWGGGGGGGGGGSAGYFSGTFYSGGGGGGGGQSYQTSAGGGAGGQVNVFTQFRAPTAGENGTNSGGGGAGGVGGQQGETIIGKGEPKGSPGTNLVYGWGGRGGAGGLYGAAGVTGNNATAPNRPEFFTFLYGSNGAGAGGYYLNRNGNAATWVNFGNRLGTEV
jgi:hypothetical protein